MSSKVSSLVIGGFEYTVLAHEGDEEYYHSLADQLNERIASLARSSHFPTAMAAAFTALEGFDAASKAEAELDRMRREHEVAAIQAAGAQAKAKETAARLQKLEEDFKTAVEEAACARLEADEANRQLVRLKREMAVLRGQEELNG